MGALRRLLQRLAFWNTATRITRLEARLDALEHELFDEEARET